MYLLKANCTAEGTAGLAAKSGTTTPLLTLEQGDAAAGSAPGYTPPGT